MHEISTLRVFVILPEQLPDDKSGGGDMLDYANEKMETAIGWFDKVTSLAATASEFADIIAANAPPSTNPPPPPTPTANTPLIPPATNLPRPATVAPKGHIKR